MRLKVVMRDTCDVHRFDSFGGAAHDLAEKLCSALIYCFMYFLLYHNISILDDILRRCQAVLCPLLTYTNRRSVRNPCRSEFATGKVKTWIVSYPSCLKYFPTRSTTDRLPSSVRCALASDSIVFPLQSRCRSNRLSRHDYTANVGSLN